MEEVTWKEINGIRIFGTMDIEVLPNDYKSLKDIDWEQRRFELVKAIVQGMSSHNPLRSAENIVSKGVEIADAVIEKLKEKKYE